MTDIETAVRCSAWSREVGLSPIGTIGSYRGYLLVETPLPWPSDINEVPYAAQLAAALPEPGFRVQALVPPVRDTAPEDRRILFYAPGADPAAFAGYRRFEAAAGDDPEATVRALAGGSGSASSAWGSPEVDVLVCTHGRRDVCCGSQGTELALQLAQTDAPDGVRFWRTSHTGGHRFAPTFLVLPQGTGWAFASLTLVEQVLHRSVPFAEVAHHYRGCAGLSSPHVQALERAVLTEVGWELLDRPRSGQLTGETVDGDGQVVSLEAGSDRWEAVIRPGRTLPVPDCMKPLSEARKSETEWLVTDMRAA